MPKYDTILFDMDGTLTDPKEGITKCVQYALEKLGRTAPPADELVWFIGPPLRESFASILQTSDHSLIEQAVDAYRERYADTGIYECFLYPGIKNLLAELHKLNYRVILATSKASVYAQQLLKHFSIDHFFNLVVGSNLDGSLCDKSDIIAHIFNRLPDLNKKRTVMIGDRIYDIKGAQDNGIDVIGVTYGYGSLIEIREAGPSYIAESAKVLDNIIKGVFHG